MGIFSFIKGAGEKIFGNEKKRAREEAERTADSRAREAKEDARASRVLEETIQDLKLKVDNLRVEIKEDMATISGMAADQATREKVILVVGNTEGIEKVDDRMTVDKSESEAQFHTVERGDTLSKIAKAHYGDANKYQVIFEANKPMLKDPDRIYPGQVLRIPRAEKK